MGPRSKQNVSAETNHDEMIETNHDEMIEENHDEMIPAEQYLQRIMVRRD